MIAVCPKCDTPLIVLLMHGVAVDMCSDCRGVWFDAGEIENLLEGLGADAASDLPVLEPVPNAPRSTGKHLCPRCDRRLQPHRPVEATWGQSGLVIDRCPKGHGLFFDASELEAFLKLNPQRPGLVAVVHFLNDFFGTDLRKADTEFKIHDNIT